MYSNSPITPPIDMESIHHVSLTQKIRSIPKVLRDDHIDDKTIKSLHQQSPHEGHYHYGSSSNSDSQSNSSPRQKSNRYDKLEQIARSPIVCYLCGQKYPLRIIKDHHQTCISNLLNFNPNVLIPKPPERPLPELPNEKPSRRGSNTFNCNGSIISSITTDSTSSSESGTTPITKMSLRLYNAEAKEIYNTKRPQSIDGDGRWMNAEMRLLMSEALEGSASSSGADTYDETWTSHAIASFRKNSPANKKHMLSNKIGYRIGSDYGVDIYPPQTLMRSPAPIYGHTSSYINRGVIISFGGYEQLQNADFQVSNKLLLFQVDLPSSPSRKRTNRFLNSGRWREIKALNSSKESIPPRAFHTAAYFKNRIYVYGGEAVDGALLGDFWCYDLNFKQWSKVLVATSDNSTAWNIPLRERSHSCSSISSSPLTYNGGHAYDDAKGSTMKTLSPDDHSLCSSPSDDAPKKKPQRSMSVISATSQLSSIANDSVIRFNLPPTTQTEGENIEGHTPPCLKNHTAILAFKQMYSQKDIPALTITDRKKIESQYKKTKDPFFIQNQPDAPNVERNSVKLIIYGGITKDGEVSRDVWEFDFESSRWSGTRGPPGRYGHSAVYYAEENKMIIYGGKNDEGKCLSDVWTYDCDTHVFERIAVNQRSRFNSPLAKNVTPSARAFHNCVIDRNLMFVMSGVGDEKKVAYDDIWVLDLYEYQWTQLSSSRAFSPSIHTTITRANEDQFVTMGGVTLPNNKPQRLVQLFHFPDPEDESNIDQDLVALGASTLGITNEFMDKQIHDILCDMIPET